MAETDPSLEFAKALISRSSVTPDDAGCQELIARRLETIGFEIESLPFGEVENLWACRGDRGPLLVFAGHTDVVPPGPLEDWNSDPFTPEVRDGLLYGRGAADMKSSVAAFVTACEAFVSDHPNHPGRIGLLITSDEEADAIDGTTRVVDTLTERGTSIDWCIVGEPSSDDILGDTIKIGRRGSVGARLVVPGTQGHVAYPDLADNPVPRAAVLLRSLVSLEWDRGNEYFPPTGLEVSNLLAGTGATNVIPGEVVIDFNLRYSTETSESEIRQRIGEVLEESGIDYIIEWQTYGLPFLTDPGTLIDAGVNAVREVTGLTPKLSTAGGTSDGRFIAPTGAEVIEIGPVNRTIHKVNECIDVEAPPRLALIYRRLMENLLLGSGSSAES